jgi:hypothetical protein
MGLGGEESQMSRIAPLRSEGPADLGEVGGGTRLLWPYGLIITNI